MSDRIRVERCITRFDDDGSPIYAPGWIVLRPTDYCIHDAHDVAFACAMTDFGCTA